MCCCCIQGYPIPSHIISQIEKRRDYTCHLLSDFVCMTISAYFTDKIGFGAQFTFDTRAAFANPMFTFITQDKIITNLKMAHSAKIL